MTPREKEVLAALAGQYHNGEAWCLNFAGVANATNVPRRYVRGVCRSLRAMGLAEHRSGLFNEDGGVAGAGYCCTALGASLAAKMDATQ